MQTVHPGRACSSWAPPGRERSETLTTSTPRTPTDPWRPTTTPSPATRSSGWAQRTGFPGPAFFGLAPGLIKTGIRSNLLGDGSITHKLVESTVGILAQSAQTYAKRVVPLLFAPELEGRTGLMFGLKAQPILPTRGLDSAYIDRYLSASEALLRRALS